MRYAAVFALTATLLAACNPNPTPENKAPTVTLTPGAAQSVLKDAPATKLTATVTDDGTITKVEFSDGTNVVTDTTAPYEFTPPTTAVGEKTYVAKAFDDKGLTGVSAGVKVNVTAPVPVATAKVRVVHGASDAPAVDVLLNDVKAISNISFGKAQPVPQGTYATVPAISTTVKINGAGTATTVFTLPAPLVPEANKNYTVIALGKYTASPTTFSVEAFVDDVTAPAAGKAKVRVIHAASTAPAKVNVYASAPGDALPATPAVSALEYKKASAYLTVDAKAYQFRVTSDANTTVAIDVPTYTLESGKIYTFVALDPAPTTTALTVLDLKDN